MQDNDDNKIRSLIHQTIDSGICMDCEHPRCASKQESLFRQVKTLITEARIDEVDSIPRVSDGIDGYVNDRLAQLKGAEVSTDE